MRRRGLLGGVLAVAGCGLSERSYEQKRDWPLVARRPQALAPNPRGPVLLVRAMQAGPGLETRGLRSLRQDGSVRSDFYETWAVPPAHGVEAALREWLAGSGRYAAVLTPGSRMTADYVLESTLTDFIADPARGTARAAMTLVVLADRGGATSLRAQYALAAEAKMVRDDAPAIVQGQLSALATLLADTEQVLAALSRPS